jgi:hypothetical protein
MSDFGSLKPYNLRYIYNLGYTLFSSEMLLLS